MIMILYDDVCYFDEADDQAIERVRRNKLVNETLYESINGTGSKSCSHQLSQEAKIKQDGRPLSLQTGWTTQLQATRRGGGGTYQ